MISVFKALLNEENPEIDRYASKASAVVHATFHCPGNHCIRWCSDSAPAERRCSKTLQVFSNSGSTNCRSPHPRPRIPLPDQPRITPPKPDGFSCSLRSHLAPSVLELRSPGASFLADLRLRLPRAVDRLPRPADVAPAEVDLRPGKRPVVENPRERLHLSGPLSLLQTVVAEILPPAAPFQRRRRPAGCRRGPGLVLLHREGME